MNGHFMWLNEFKRDVVSSGPLLGIILRLSHVRVATTAHRTFVACIRATWLQWSTITGLGLICEVETRTDQFYRSVLQSVGIDKEPFIKINAKVHLLGIVLIKSSNILRQISLVKDAMKALTWPDLAILIFVIILIAYTLICHLKM